MKIKVLSLFVAFFATTTLWAYDFKSGDLCYNITGDNTVEVTWDYYYHDLTSVNIPSSVADESTGRTYSVTSIGEGAFSYCRSLTSVIIPNSVTSIGGEAFTDCTGLTSVTLPNSVTSIGGSAFCVCTGLTSITIPNSVTSIGERAFLRCTGLTSVTIPNSVTSIGGYAFSDCTGLTSITIPDGVTSIGYSAFEGCTGLTSVTIGNSVTSIEFGTFSGCTGLTSVTLPNSVTSIGGSAFYVCTGLTSVTIGNRVTSIGESAFSHCTGLTSVTLPNSVTSIEDHAFYGCTGLTSIIVEGGNTTYDSRDNCNAIIETATNTLVQGCNTTIIPNSVTSIGGVAFGSCTGLTSITIPDGVTSIGESAFESCTSLTSITIPNSVTSIEFGTFSGCTGLTSVTIPNSVTSIGVWAFAGCTGLTSVTIPNSVTSIGDGAFGECTGLTSITIPNSVTSIGNEAFSYCTGLTSVSIGNSVTSIGVWAFAGCMGLTSVVIGNNNELDIEAHAFSDCENLTSVTCYANVPPIIGFDEDYYDDEGHKLETPVLRGAFDTDRLQKMRLYVPAKAISQYNEAEEWKDFGRIAPIGATTIDTNEEQPIVQPSFTDVTITWKITPNAETYTIVITRGTETVCTLVFNADGQLTNIAFAAPSRNGTPRHAPAAVMTEQGYQFTVTGLESGTQYDYTLSVKDNNGKELQNYAGAFTTKGESTAIGNPSADNTTDQLKVIRNGQLLIQRDGKTYTLTGEEVK